MKKDETKGEDEIPNFVSEEEEASWWDAHPEVLSQRFREARQQGRVRRLSQTALPGSFETVAIRIPGPELSRARELAAKRGILYQTYIEMLLREALDAEEKKLASKRTILWQPCFQERYRHGFKAV